MYRLINKIVIAVSAVVAVAAIAASFHASPQIAPGNVAESAAFCPIAFKSEGSTTVHPITRDSEGAFESFWGPGTDVQIASIGSGAGINALTAGLVEHAPSSRPLNAGEATGKYVHKVALDAFVIAVKDDPAMDFLNGGITKGHLLQIYGAGAGITTLQWDDLTPLIPGAPAAPIIPRARITASGSQPDFNNQIGVSTAAEDATIVATGLPRLVESVDMATEATVAINVISYTSLANLGVAGMRVIPLSNNAPIAYFMPTQTTVLNGSYPMPRQLFVAVRDKNLNPRIDNSNFVRADDFTNWLRSSSTTALIAAEGFVPVPAGLRPSFPDWDINLDGNTDLGDIGGVSSKWGLSNTCKGWIRGDANNSGSVGLADIGAVTSRWGLAGFQCAIPVNPCPE